MTQIDWILLMAITVGLLQVVLLVSLVWRRPKRKSEK
jgi:hypothetical protein